MIFLLFLGLSHGFVILQRNFTSMSVCGGQGAEVEILVKSLENSGLVIGKDFSIECENSLEDIKKRVLVEDAIGIGGIRPTEDLIRSGLLFTHPTFYSGLNILIKRVDMNDNMKLFQVFSFSVWVLLFLTPLILGLSRWLYSIILSKSSLNLKSFLKHLWEAHSAFMLSPKVSPAGPGRLLEISLSVYTKLIFLVLAAGYASYTYQKLVTFIDKFGDLAGQLVLVEPQYEDLCGQFTIYYYSFSQDFYDDFDEALSLLHEGKYWGIIADHTYLVQKMLQDSDFTINTYPFFNFNYVGIYGQNLPSNTSKLVNKALASIENTQYPVEIQKKYDLIHDFKSSTQAVVYGEDILWVILVLVVVIVVGLCLSIVPVNGFYVEFWDFCCKRRKNLIDEVELTNRTEIVDFSKKDLETDRNEPDWSADINDHFARLIRVTALSIMEYEDSSFAAITELVEYLKETNKEKIELIKQIEGSINK